MLVAVGTVCGVPTQFESTIVSITDSLHGVLTTAAPFTEAAAHEMDMGHDEHGRDRAHDVLVAGGGGTLVFPEGRLPHPHPEGRSARARSV